MNRQNYALINHSNPIQYPFNSFLYGSVAYLWFLNEDVMLPLIEQQERLVHGRGLLEELPLPRGRHELVLVGHQQQQRGGEAGVAALLQPVRGLDCGLREICPRPSVVEQLVLLDSCLPVL